ncbi:MAG: hypothetical protein K6F64_05145 [Clostridia bacterium]|nr:hypothetical protein [Clostridia bacterium]
MKKTTGKQNILSRIRSKYLIIAAVVIVFIVALLTVVLSVKDSILFNSAQAKVDNSEFSAAYSELESVSGDKATALRAYVELRLEIDREYPALLAEYDNEKIFSWKEKVDSLTQETDYFSEKTAEEVRNLSNKLNTICSLNDEYNGMQADILEMMDIFNEINRLYTKDSEGHNTSFTVSEEKRKIQNWEMLCGRLTDFSSRLPGGEKVYLLGYLIRETRGELSDLQKAMNMVTQSGYSDMDIVRLSGEGQKNFPSIKNSNGVAVSVSGKDDYVKYMSSGVYKALVEYLAEYYVGM